MVPNHGVTCCFMQTLSTLVDMGIGSFANIPRPWMGDWSILYLGISPIFERGLNYEVKVSGMASLG